MKQSNNMINKYRDAVIGKTIGSEKNVMSANKVISILELEGMSLDDAVEHYYDTVYPSLCSEVMFVWEEQL
jgi:exonuclease VII small subunit